MTEFNYEALIKDIPDYPKPGVVFKDITPLLGDAEGMKKVVEGLANPYREMGVTKVMGGEARGFMVGAPVAVELGAGFVPARKPGKLPSTVIKESFSKEYGVDTIEMHIDSINENDVVLIHDDLLATGGTAKAAYKLVQHFNPRKVYMNFIIEIKDEGLHGRDEFEGIDLTTLLTI